jgi:hypothetical protein
MSDKFTPRAKRLLIIAIVTPWLFLIVYYGAPMLNSQRRNLDSVHEHIEKISPQWDQFRAEHRGFDKAHLFAWTGSNGLFGVWGEVPSDAHIAELRAFMESTKPPRPVYLESLFVVDPKAIEFLENARKSEPGGAANGSQPIRSETNRTSSAAGSRR